MADVWLSVISNRPGATEVVLINGEPSVTGYRIDRAGGVDLGMASYDKVFSGPRGTQGAKLVGATAQNRLSTWNLQVVGTSEDDLQHKLSTLWQLDEELRSYGGTAYWRSWGSSFKMTLEVLDSGLGTPSLDPELWPQNHIVKVPFALATPPYMDGPAMDILDDFSIDSEANYTFDTGSSSDVSVALGVLTCTANATTEKRLIHTGIGYPYGDHQVTVKTTPGATTTNFKTGAVIKRIDSQNYLECYIDDNGTVSRIRIDKVVTGSRTNLATANFSPRITNNVPMWVRGRIEGNKIFTEIFLTSPNLGGSGDFGPVNYDLSTAEQAIFGETITGQAGVSWVPQVTSATLDDFQIDAFFYRDRSLPDTLSLRGAIPGDAPALFEAFVTQTAGTSAAAVWAALGWFPPPTVFNRVWNGDFENAALITGGVPNGWSVAAVTNMNAAATSIGTATPSTPPGAKFGLLVGSIVCPATTDSGANFRMFRRFRKGITYTAECWVLSGSGPTTATSIRVGNAAANDTATSGGTALSATVWQKLTVTWTPTADRDDAHVAVKINAATATTIYVDGVQVYEGSAAPTTPNQTEGRGGWPALGLIEAENMVSGTAPSSNANFRSGFGTGTGAGTRLSVVIDPTLLTPDDYLGETVAVEVWARADVVSGTTYTTVLQAYPLTATVLQPIYSEEFGSSGKVLVSPSSGTHHRFFRLGTLRLPTDAGRYLLQGITTGGAPNWDYVVLLPAGSRALSPSGRVLDANFPAFVPFGVTTEIARRFRADLSGTLKEPITGAPESAAPGLGGSLLEMKPGNLEVIAKLSSMVPDDPTASATDEQLAHTASVHLKVTPRWRLGRSS